MNSNHPTIDDVIYNRTLTAYLGLQLKQFCRSPLPGRTDSDPSFQVFTGRDGNQMWKDMGLTGAGSCGNIISLHRILNGCNTDRACKELMAWSGTGVMCSVSTAKAFTSSRRTQSSNDKIGVRTNKPVETSRYIRESGLPVPTWVKEQLNLYVDEMNNLCFKTNNGIHVKGGKLKNGNKNYAGNIGSAGYSICGNTENGQWLITEGLGDMLAAIEMMPTLAKCAFLILNSTSIVPQAIQYLHTQDINEMALLFDTDKAGDTATEAFKNIFVDAQDFRVAITHGKDIKATWQHEREKVCSR